jgi:hypothetical protein
MANVLFKVKNATILFYKTVTNFLGINDAGDKLEINDNGDTLEL